MSALHKISIIPLSLFHLPTIIKKLLLVMHGLVWYSSVMLCTRAVYFLLVFFMLGGLLNCTSSFVVKENFIITISEDHKWKIHTPWWETIWPYINNLSNRNIIITYTSVFILHHDQEKSWPKVDWICANNLIFTLNY